jgi:hypothetical protein
VDNGLTDGQSQASGALVRRVARSGEPETGAVFVADCSYSMDIRDGGADGMFGSGPRRIDRLAKVLDYVLKRVRLRSLVCFNDVPVEVELKGRVLLPEPNGGTALHLALDYVGVIAPKPLRCIVLSDGSPNDPGMALAAARSLAPMVIDAYYVGRDNDQIALAFMAELARCGGPGGKSGVFDLSETQLVAETVLLRLTGPGR